MLKDLTGHVRDVLVHVADLMLADLILERKSQPESASDSKWKSNGIALSISVVPRLLSEYCWPCLGPCRLRFLSLCTGCWHNHNPR